MIFILFNENLKKFAHLGFDYYISPKLAPRKKWGGGKPPKDRDVIKHGEKLAKSLEKIETENIKVKKIYPPEFDPKLIFIIDQEVEDDNIIDVDEEKLRTNGIEIIEKEGDNWLIVFASDNDLRKFKTSLTTYKNKQLKYKGKDIQHPLYSSLFNNIKDIIPRYPENRLGAKIKEYYNEDNFPEEFLNVRIDFYWFTREITFKRMDLCIKILKKNSCNIKKSYVYYGLASIVASMNLLCLKEIINITEIYKIEIIKEVPEEKREITTVALEHIPNLNLTDIKSKSYVCLIDTGVVEKHALLNGAIVESILKTDETDLESDEDGHGTLLTGSILYGKLEEEIKKNEITPSARIISVKIAQKYVKHNISEFNDTIIESIEEVYDKYRCKLYLLSYLPTHNPLSKSTKTRDHQLSIMLDRLIFELNIVIVCPIGNYFFNDMEDYPLVEDLWEGKYTQYLFQNKIFEGASANSVLTVGSIAGKDEYPTSSSSINIAALKVISRKNDPSIFNRTGPGLGKSVKPDLLAFGGNKIYYAESHYPFKTLEHLAIAGPKYDSITSNLIDYDSGTCFSACYATYLIARLIEYYPGHTGNFYRALIVNRSRKFNPSSDFLKNNDIQNAEDKKKLMNLSGYGIANDENLFFGNPKTISLYYEGEIPLDGVHVFSLPIPKQFKNIDADRGITVSLAYNPYVKSRKEYRTVELEFRYVYEKMDSKEVYQYFTTLSNTEELDDGDDTVKKIKSESQYGFEIDINSTIRNKSTLQLARYKWKKFPSGTRQTTKNKILENNHFIVVQCKPKSWFDPNIKNISKQSYSIIVTIWHDKSNRIYEHVQEVVREHIKLKI